MTKEYDLVILGGGTGGYVAAIRAAQLGMSVAIVEKNKLGGTCLHQGCIPSKALLKTASLYREMNQADEFGLETKEININLNKVHESINDKVTTLQEGIISILKKHKIDVIRGTGRILGSSIFSPSAGTISVEHDEDEKENTMLVNKNVLIATGSTPASLANIDVDGHLILNSNHALQLDSLPDSIIIVGGGVIGMEWASMLCDLGVKVTVVEYKDAILSGEDEEIQVAMQEHLERRGVTFYIKTELLAESIVKEQNQVRLNVKNNDNIMELTANKMLLAVGRIANVNQIGLQNTEIELANGYIATNEMYQTKESHIYAIGDCIGGMQLAHVASKEGMIAVEHMAEKNPAPLEAMNIPSCVYTFPEIARVGMTEEAAIKAGYEVKIGKFPFTGIGKAHVNGDTKGFSKIIVDKASEDILGVHLIGSQVTELIAEASLAKVLNASAWELSQTVHPHPSLSEVMLESALAVDKKQIHG